jgi:hypothetical protein
VNDEDKGYVIYQDWPVPSTTKKKPGRREKIFEGTVKDIKAGLDDFRYATRKDALEKLVALNVSNPPRGENPNLHMHTFFSYNAYDWSPTRFAWEAREAGLHAAGIIDFDVLDGVEEFLDAGAYLGLRATAGFETRGYLPSFSELVIDSPGEPGVHYIAGAGFVRAPEEGTGEARVLESFRQTAKLRNKELVGRINAKLPDLAVDYEREVMTRTPSGNATERHIISAYVDKSIQVFPLAQVRAGYWSEVFAMPKEEALALMEDRPRFEEKVRARLAKSGGLGYVKPGPLTFPAVASVYAWIKACGAIPMDSWLDGTSPGESRIAELFECNRAHGALAMNLIPDRNWNIKDAREKRIKLDNLGAIVKLADAAHMPIHIGTEGNKAGLPFVDDLGGADLAPFKKVFLKGANILVGHSLLSRYAGFSYVGAEAEGEFGRNIERKNAFFESVGALPPLQWESAQGLRESGPAKALEAFRDSAGRGHWNLPTPHTITA